MTLHLVPVGDTIDHVTSGDCPCGPAEQQVQADNGAIRQAVMHRSLDGREAKG